MDSSPALPTVVRLDRLVAAGLAGDGVHRSLAGDGDRDLNVNLAHLDPGSEITDHINEDVDVLMVVLAGTGQLRIDATDHELVASALAYIARGRRRSIVAGPGGLTYLTAHRSRGPLRVMRGAPPIDFSSSSQ